MSLFTMRLQASIPGRCEIHAPRRIVAVSGPKRLRSINRNAVDTEVRIKYAKFTNASLKILIKLFYHPVGISSQ
jgi:hypothetical protein